MTPLDIIHPDLLALIREAAGERASRVLVSLATSNQKCIATCPTAVGKTSIQKLEAKLGDAFREELADLYWHAGERIIHTDPTTARFLSEVQRTRRDPDLFAEQPWRKRVEGVQLVSHAFDCDSTEHLTRLNRLARGGIVPLSEIARAGYALIPLADYNIHEAWALEAQGALDSAKFVLERNLERSLCNEDQGRTLNNLGHIASIEQDIGAQLTYYERAACLLPLAAPTICFWARLTLLHGTLAQQALALLQVESVAEIAPSSFAECLTAHRAEALSGSPLIQVIPKATWNQAGPNATRLLELLN